MSNWWDSHEIVQPPPQAPGIVEPAPGFEERQKGVAVLDNAAAASAYNEFQGGKDRRAMLGNIMALANTGWTPGPLAHEKAEFKKFINSNVPLPEGWKFNAQDIANQEEFNKIAMNFANRQFSAIGGTGTDTKFNASFGVSPNETMSRLGIKNVSRMLLGNEDAIEAQWKAFQRARRVNPNLSFTDFQSEFNTKFDPRVFQMRYMPQSERQAFIDAMEPVERARFLDALVHAAQNKWIDYHQKKEK